MGAVGTVDTHGTVGTVGTVGKHIVNKNANYKMLAVFDQNTMEY